MTVHPVLVLRRRAHRSEGGFTIVEVMMSLTLIAVAMAAVTGTFYSSLRTSSVSSFRSAGSALATRETEAVHGVAYANVGFYSGQPGYAATFDGATTVTLGSGNPPTAAVDPAETKTVGPIQYSITRYVTWADALDSAGATLSQAYKKTTVVVAWADQAGPHSVRQDSIFYPGAQAVYSGPNGASTTTTTAPPAPGAPGQPTALAATVPAVPDGYTKVDLAWTAPIGVPAVDHYRVEASVSSTFATAVINGTTGATSYRVSGLANDTPYYFRVFAISTPSPDESGASIASSVATATTLNPPPVPCAVNSMVLSSPTDGGVRRYPSGGDLAEDITVTLSVNTQCNATTFAARAELTPGGTMNPTVASGVNPKTFGGSGVTRTVTWAMGSTDWSTGDHKIVLVDGAGNPVTPSAFVLVRVCTSSSCP